MKEFSVYDLNLVLQLAIFALFLLGIYHIKAGKKSLGKHRLFMGLAVVLNAISILLIMGRSFITSFGFLASRPHQFGPFITWVHVIVGGYAEISGVWFFRKHPPNVRLRMRMTTIFWAVALVLGIAYYVYYYML
jgi:hypothetical protein